LAGILLSGPAAHAARAVLAPVRDLFAATFFVFIGFGVDPVTLPSVAWIAGLLAAIGAATKLITGWFSGGQAGLDLRGRARAGVLLTPRGEFSIAIAALGAAAGVEPKLAPLTVAYVLFLAVAAPLMAHLVDPVVARLGRGTGPEPSQASEEPPNGG
jgi:CPA2 family monovalent cation:H+ antiporter-2